MKVSDYLRVPYLVTAQSRQLADGSWVRRVEHPELPDCSAQADSITDALRCLDARRIEVVLRMLADGAKPPIRSRVLGAAQARRRVEHAGLERLVGPVWELDADELAGHHR
jgi:predicted RNase H-like HicB family nuclease